jgi:hypothetical protein
VVPAVADDADPGNRWEVGSEFHWDDRALVGHGDGRPGWLPVPHTLFASASGALTVLISLVGPPRRLHLPSYFCMGVADALAREVAIGWYRELPDGAGPHLGTLDAAPGDAVLVANLFGRGSREPWDAWYREHPLVTVIEDHTHDPLSDWARASTASYCVASLRKTLPVPDGALLWSPRGRILPRPTPGENAGAALKLAAMNLKAAWLAGKAVPKADFRSLQQAGESALHGGSTAPSAFTRAVLPRLDAWRLRSVWAGNVNALIKSLPPGHDAWRPLVYGPQGAVGFNVQVLCASEAARDALLAHLAHHRIFAPVHWRQPTTGLWSGDGAAAGYASRILTIPVDFRYGGPDVARVAEALALFRPATTGRTPEPVARSV